MNLGLIMFFFPLSFSHGPILIYHFLPFTAALQKGNRKAITFFLDTWQFLETKKNNCWAFLCPKYMHSRQQSHLGCQTTSVRCLDSLKKKKAGRKGGNRRDFWNLMGPCSPKLKMSFLHCLPSLQGKRPQLLPCLLTPGRSGSPRQAPQANFCSLASNIC